MIVRSRRNVLTKSDLAEIFLLQLPLLLYTTGFLSYCWGCLYVCIWALMLPRDPLIALAALCMTALFAVLSAILAFSPALSLAIFKSEVLKGRISSTGQQTNKIGIGAAITSLLLTTLLPAHCLFNANGGLDTSFLLADCFRPICREIGYNPDTTPAVQYYMTFAMMVIFVRRFVQIWRARF